MCIFLVLCTILIYPGTSHTFQIPQAKRVTPIYLKLAKKYAFWALTSNKHRFCPIRTVKKYFSFAGIFILASPIFYQKWWIQLFHFLFYLFTDFLNGLSWISKYNVDVCKMPAILLRLNVLITLYEENPSSKIQLPAQTCQIKRTISLDRPTILTHWGLRKWSLFEWKFWTQFRWDAFLRIQLRTCEHWLR